MQLFVKGRQSTFSILREHISDGESTIWFHCASLGEFEQGVPVMEALRKKIPKYKILVSFFSPSGYEVKKQTPLADAVVYLPLDTRINAKKFLDLSRPKIALFVKYEFWPNYLFELEYRHIPTYLISGVFRENQIFFKSYGGFMRKALKNFNHIFVQNESSKTLLGSIDVHNVSVSGDTRFDRVSQQLEQDNSLDFVEKFKGTSLCLVCGSTWPEDENVLLDFINTTKAIKFIVAPHKIDKSKIQTFQKDLQKKSICYSEISDEKHNLQHYDILIIDTIGLLTKIYSYADIAYVGGAMGNTGLHNILEPATFGVPVVIGKNYKDFPEAERLRSLAGLFSISNAEECQTIMQKLCTDNQFRNKTGMIAGHFVQSNTGATKIILNHIIKNFS